MATRAQIEANRRNAQESTGPKTPEGKARVALNALKHGIRANTFFASLGKTPVFDEDPQDFADLVQSLVDQYQPEGPFEQACVEDIAINTWRLGRIASAETGHIASAQAILLSGPGRDNPRLHARNRLPDFDTLEKLNRYETSIQRQLRRSFDALAASIRQRRSQIAQPNPPHPAQDADQQRETADIRREVLGLLAEFGSSAADPESQSIAPQTEPSTRPISAEQSQSLAQRPDAAASPQESQGLRTAPRLDPPIPVFAKQSQSPTSHPATPAPPKISDALRPPPRPFSSEQTQLACTVAGSVASPTNPRPFSAEQTQFAGRKPPKQRKPPRTKDPSGRRKPPTNRKPPKGKAGRRAR